MTTLTQLLHNGTLISFAVAVLYVAAVIVCALVSALAKSKGRRKAARKTLRILLGAAD